MEDIYILRKDLHVVRGDDTHVLFHSPSLTFFEVNRGTADLLEDYISGMPVGELCEKYKVDYGKLEGFFRGLAEQIGSEVRKFTERMREEDQRRRERVRERTGKEEPAILERLTLNISNDCNLRCRYCYAGGGSYGGARGLMKLEVAIRAIDAAYERFDGIDTIQFFGGEPALNVRVMRGVCEYVRFLHREGRIAYPPSFAVVTNGTILSEEFLDVIKTYNIGVTVSLDGPACVNDAVRIYPDGRGTYERISKFIRKVKQESSAHVGIEATYNRVHIEQGVTMPMLMDFFYDEFGIRSAHIPPVGTPADSSLSLYPEYSRETYRTYADAVSYTIRSATTDSWRSFSLAERRIRGLVNRRVPRYICPAGISGTLSVSSEGDIYPCFMFIGKEEFKMGNIFDRGFSDPCFRKVNAMFESNAKDMRDDCRECWARGLCTGCLGANYDETGSIFEVPRTHCELHKAMVERTLVELARVRGRPDEWGRLVENMTGRERD